MANLAQCLIGAKPEKTGNHQDDELWEYFVAELNEGKDLESALQAVQMSESLSDYIVEQAWKYVYEADAKVFDNVIQDNNLLPISRLYRHLFSSTHRSLSVVTPNYDRLAEYAADIAGYCHYTGFTYGYIRRRQTDPRISFTRDHLSARTIDIWKVHGCLDWFMNGDGDVIAVASSRSIPAEFRPAIVTPGIRKYEQTHQEPFRSVIAGADTALNGANAYLCIGFGFNDTHIQPKLMERWRQGDALLVILTKALSDSAKQMLAKANGKEFLALEEAPTGTRMWSHRYPEVELLEDVSLWDLPDFLDHTV